MDKSMGDKLFEIHQEEMRKIPGVIREWDERILIPPPPPSPPPPIVKRVVYKQEYILILLGGVVPRARSIFIQSRGIHA